MTTIVTDEMMMSLLMDVMALEAKIAIAAPAGPPSIKAERKAAHMRRRAEERQAIATADEEQKRKRRRMATELLITALNEHR